MKKTNVCFIGAGLHSTTNIYPAALEAGAEIQAIATRSFERSRNALQRLGSEGSAYDDYRSMLEAEECAGVVVVAQPEDHAALVLDCINAGKNVFVEKPLGMSEAEAADIARAAEAAGVQVMVGFMKRYAPIYQKLKELIDGGSLGPARSFQARFAVDSTLFCENDEQFMKFAAIHMIDLVRFLFGEAVEVKGFKNSSKGFISHSISLKFGTGVVGSLYFSGMTAWTRESENITVTFDEGFAFADEINALTIHKSQHHEEQPWQSIEEADTHYKPSATPMSGAYRDLYLRGFVGEMAHFFECCRSGTTPLSNAQDNVRTMALCDRILDSLS